MNTLSGSRTTRTGWRGWSDRSLLAAYAVLALALTGRTLVERIGGDTTTVRLEAGPRSTSELLGARLAEGGVVDLTVPRDRLGTVFEVVSVAQPLLVAAVVLGLLVCSDRFVRELSAGRPFSVPARRSFRAMSVLAVAWPAVDAVLTLVRSTAAALDLDLPMTSPQTMTLVLVGLGFSALANVVYATLEHGDRVQQDTEGLV